MKQFSQLIQKKGDHFSSASNGLVDKPNPNGKRGAAKQAEARTAPIQ